MHISCAICVQTVRDMIKQLKRLIHPVFLYRNLPFIDFQQTVNVVRTSLGIDEILPLSKSFKKTWEINDPQFQ
jgi:hypothetical protein